MCPAKPSIPEVQSVNRYRIHGELASGGMGTVHIGRLVGAGSFTRTVAIKRLHPHLATEPEFVAMLIEEASIAASIHHRNVVSTLDVVHQDGELLLVMDYVEGETLARLLARCKREGRAQRPALSLIVRVIADTLFGLHAAHSAKSANGRLLHLVHRDVSPHNIIVGTDGVSRVLDFGIAKTARQHTTLPGKIKGKFAYMAPEQVRGQALDARTDVFAAGIVLWECLTLRRLFVSENNQATMQSVLMADVPPPSSFDPSLPKGLDRIVLKALARRPKDRFQTADDFAVALVSLVGRASRSSVGQWVAATASQSLAQHAQCLRQVEASVVTEQISVQRSADPPLQLQIDEAAVDEPAVLSPSVVPPPAAISSTGPYSSAWSAAPPLESIRSAQCAKNRKLAFIAAPVLFSLGVGLSLATSSGSSRAPQAVESSPSIGASRPNTASAAQPDSSWRPPALLLADSKDTRGGGHSAGSSVLSVEDIPSESRVASGRPRAPARAAREKPGAMQPEKARPKAQAVSAASSQSPARRAPVPAVAAAARSDGASCDPPYRTDELGIRRIKKGCL